MLEIIPIDTPTLGDRSYLVHDGTMAFVVDPQRDIDQVLSLAGGRGVEIRHVFETHVHNDYVTGGYALAAATGATYHVNAADPVNFGRSPVAALRPSGRDDLPLRSPVGRRGPAAARHGWQVCTVAGGMHAWSPAGLPVVGSAGRGGRDG
jgi:glyoxylase-like metal-dependent hydrolase (beta-lactamase superfamily II)